MSKKYQIGPFVLDAVAQALTRDGKIVTLGQRAIAVLTVLVPSAGEYVPKTRIIEPAWPGLVVEESNLSVQVSSIRRALAQTNGGEGWLETLSRRGYRFVGPVSALADTTAYQTSGSTARSNLPEPLTSFVGRERELAEIRSLLSSNRLVTLTGAGGVGKTRTALRIATQVLDAHADGARLVEFAALRDPGLLPQAVASALGLTEESGKSIQARLAEYLRSRRLLLILDNAEHLVGACAQLVGELMQECKHIAILVTSRERLGLADELVYRMPSLSIPESGGSVSVEGPLAYESAQLFQDRAQRLVPRFAITDPRATGRTTVPSWDCGSCTRSSDTGSVAGCWGSGSG